MRKKIILNEAATKTATLLIESAFLPHPNNRKNGLMHLRRKGVLFLFLKGHKHTSRFPLSIKLTQSLTISDIGIFV